MTQTTEADIRAACEEAGVPYDLFCRWRDNNPEDSFVRAILALARRIAADREAKLLAALRQCAEAPLSGWTIAQAIALAAIEENQRGQG